MLHHVGYLVLVFYVSLLLRDPWYVVYLKLFLYAVKVRRHSDHVSVVMDSGSRIVNFIVNSIRDGTVFA